MIKTRIKFINGLNPEHESVFKHLRLGKQTWVEREKSIMQILSPGWIPRFNVRKIDLGINIMCNSRLCDCPNAKDPRLQANKL